MKKIMMQRLLTATVLIALSSTPVLAETSTNTSKNNEAPRQSTMIVLDGSNSMWGQLQGVNKIVTARDSLKTLLKSADGSINFGLLTYGGNKRKKGCNDFTLVSKPEDYDMVSLLKDIYRMNPRGRSPIAAALKKAASILPPENAHILLVSDGEESCDGDPCAVAKALREKNPSLQIDVIGFRAEKEAQLECIAENGNGAFVVADNTERLKTLLAGVRAKANMIQSTNTSTGTKTKTKTPALAQMKAGDQALPGSVEISIKPDSTRKLPRANYSIYTLKEKNVANFTSRTHVTEYLKPGTYRVKALWAGRSETKTVTIESGKTSKLEFDAGESGTLKILAINSKQQPTEVNYSIYLQNGDFISKHVFRSELEVRVPVGKYRVKADRNGKIIEKKFSVKANAQNIHTFKFDEK